MKNLPKTKIKTKVANDTMTAVIASITIFSSATILFLMWGLNSSYTLFKAAALFGLGNQLPAVLMTSGEPTIFFSDLTSGPNTGGPGGNGAYVTLYGKWFGSSQDSSYVTVGGVRALVYLAWSNDVITFQVPREATAGGIIVHRPFNGSSDTLPFAIRAGKIYFVASDGDNTAVGTFDQPWQTLWFAKRQLGPGDTVYIKDSLSVTELEPRSRGAALEISERMGAQPGTRDLPIAIIALPGAEPVFGCADPDCPEDGVTTFVDHWILAGLHATGNLPEEEFDEQLGWGSAGFKINSSDIRLVGNTVIGGGYYGITIPNALYEGSSLKRDNIVVLGNHVYGTRNSMIYHGGFPVIGEHVTTGFEVGWNYAHDNLQGFGIKILAHKEKDLMRDIRIHDNTIINSYYAGIQLGGIINSIDKPSHEFIEDAVIYNNVIARAGTAWTAGKTVRDHAMESCIELGFEKKMRAAVTHNTLVDCGKSALDIREDFESIKIENNIFVQTDGKPFIVKKAEKNPEAVNNLYFGGNSPPAYDQRAVAGDPSFFNAALNNFRPSAESAARDQAGPTAIDFDRDGVRRSLDGAADLGAYEYNPDLIATFWRGDADGNALLGITDAIFILRHLFLGGPTPGCLDAADTNDDGVVNIADGKYLLNYLFLGGYVPPGHFDVCGADITLDNLGCSTNICGSY